MPRFTGYAEHAFDEKGRVVVPARFRERLGPHFILTIADPDLCLALYPIETWEEVCARLDSAPVKDARFRRLVRYLFANTDQTGCDGQGRLLVPAALRAYAGIERDAVSIGTHRRVEIWAKERDPLASPQDEEFAGFATELGLY